MEKLDLGISAKKGANAGIIGALALWGANAIVSAATRNGVAIPIPAELIAGGLLAGIHSLMNAFKQKRRVAKQKAPQLASQ